MRDRMPFHLKLTNPWGDSDGGSGSGSQSSGPRGQSSPEEIGAVVPVKRMTDEQVAELPPHMQQFFRKGGPAFRPMS